MSLLQKKGRNPWVVHLIESKGPSGGLSPLIDPVMESAAYACGERVVGVLLTGMGDDGLKGMRAIKEAGGQTIAQDESALIFGMPKAVIDAGLADQILPASKIAENLMQGDSK